MQRRHFVKKARAVPFAATAGKALAVKGAAAGEPPEPANGTSANTIDIDTISGRLRGTSQGGLIVFKGIPYAEPPVGPLRFRSPHRVRPWKGIRDAREFGPAAIQTVAGLVGWVYSQPDRMSEDCLTLNIWAPTPSQPKPVIVWIHGGGYRTGATSMPVFDGAPFAEIGNVVMVTINYRLGVLGWAAHRDLADPTTGDFANWAVQDQIEALRWVRENIAAFGGDPARVTVMGQSGGAINAVMIAHGKTGRDLFQQAIIMSAPYICPPATLDVDGWNTAMEALAGELKTDVRGLRDVPAIKLHQAELRQWMQRTVKTNTGRAYRGTVRDDRVLDEWSAYYPLPDVPMIIGTTSQEGSSQFDLYDPISKTKVSPPPPDDTAAQAMVAARLGMLYDLHDRSPKGDDIIGYYQQRTREEGRDSSMVETLRELFGDAAGRHYAVRKAEQAARRGRKDIFYYQYSLPLRPPNGPPGHATELSIFFGTFGHPHYREKVGDGDLQRNMSRAIIEAFSAFAATGRPFSSLLPSWPSFRSPAHNVMVLGENQTLGQVLDLPKDKQLSCLDELAALRP